MASHSCGDDMTCLCKCIFVYTVAVVVAFFVCWAPFHSQRLMTLYIKTWSAELLEAQSHVFYVSGVLYFFSSTVNPILYNLLSRKFRQAFKRTLCRCCVNIDVPAFYRLKAKLVLRRRENVPPGADCLLPSPVDNRIPLDKPLRLATFNNNNISRKLQSLPNEKSRSSKDGICTKHNSRRYLDQSETSCSEHAHSDGRLQCRYKYCSGRGHVGNKKQNFAPKTYARSQSSMYYDTPFEVTRCTRFTAISSPQHNVCNEYLDCASIPRDSHTDYRSVPRDVHTDYRDIPRDTHTDYRDYRSVQRDKHYNYDGYSSRVPRDNNYHNDDNSSRVPRGNNYHNDDNITVLPFDASFYDDNSHVPCHTQNYYVTTKASYDTHNIPRDPPQNRHIYTTPITEPYTTQSHERSHEPRGTHNIPRDTHSTPRDTHSIPRDTHSIPRDTQNDDVTSGHVTKDYARGLRYLPECDGATKCREWRMDNSMSDEKPCLPE